MTHYLCETCGTQFADGDMPPARCPICEDERQYVGWNGQQWTTLEALRASHGIRVADDAGVLSLDIEPQFAIPQRAAFLPTPGLKVLWESLSLVTDSAIAALKEHGGVDVIAISHPHFYASMVEWSEALGGVPILLHEADRQWVQRASRHVQFWQGDTCRLSDDIQLLRLGGHFEGSTALHWAGGPRPGGALFPGDAIQVVSDRRHATFMYSYPNFIPMRPADVTAIRDRLHGIGFEDVYGYSRGRNILGDARAAVDASFERYLKAISFRPGLASNAAGRATCGSPHGSRVPATGAS